MCQSLGIFFVILSFRTISANLLSDFLRAPLFHAGDLWLRAFNTSLPGQVGPLQYLDYVSDWTSKNIATCIFCAFVLYVVFQLYKILFVPLNRIRNLNDVGYVPDGCRSLKDTANLIQKQRRVEFLPPVYPNGWFGIVESHSLKRLESRAVNILGKYR